jgi:hypothetical protein
MLKRRVGSIHLLQNREQVLMFVRRDGVCEHSRDRRLINTGSGRQPQRDGVKVSERPDALLVKRLAGSSSTESVCRRSCFPRDASTGGRGCC